MAQRLDVIAQPTGAEFRAPATNPALDLARSLAEIQPTLNDVSNTIIAKGQSDADALAKKDALAADGAKYADAVAQGKILPTQNPWYIQAYARESSAISAQKDLNAMSLDSTTWPEQNDPQAFQKRWQEGVANVSKNYTDPDEAAGFTAAANQVTQQTIAANQSQNVQRITEERTQNVTALGADALVQSYKQHGGVPDGLSAWQALQGAHLRWTATGGTEEAWQKMVPQMMVTAGYSTGDSGMIDILRQMPLDGSPPPAPEPAPDVSNDPNAPPAVTMESLMRPEAGDIHSALTQQESGGNPNAKTSITGAIGAHQIEPATFAQYAQPGEDIHNPADNTAVFNRMITNYKQRFNNDPARIAVAYFSGPGNVAPAGSPTPYLHDRADPTGKTTSSYVNDVLGRLGKTAIDPANPQAPVQNTTKLAANGSPQIAGPSLYDQGGIAENVETARYRIDSNASDAQTSKMRTIKALQDQEGYKALNDIFQSHGTSVLTGSYDVPSLIGELQGKGYSPQGIQAALNDLHNGVADVQGLMEAKHKLASDNPAQAKALFDLSLSGKRSGWSQSYEDAVGMHVLNGDLTHDDGEKMVADAVAKSKADQADTTGAGAKVRSYSDLRDRAESLAQTVAFNATKSYGDSSYTDPTIFQKLRNGISNAGGNYLSAHPGDFQGASQAMAAETASELVTLRQQHLQPKNKPAISTDAGGNPRR